VAQAKRLFPGKPLEPLLGLTFWAHSKVHLLVVSSTVQQSAALHRQLPPSAAPQSSNSFLPSEMHNTVHFGLLSAQEFRTTTLDKGISIAC
jgi:hypothetical protein